MPTATRVKLHSPPSRLRNLLIAMDNNQPLRSLLESPWTTHFAACGVGCFMEDLADIIIATGGAEQSVPRVSREFLVKEPDELEDQAQTRFRAVLASCESSALLLSDSCLRMIRRARLASHCGDTEVRADDENWRVVSAGRNTLQRSSLALAQDAEMQKLRERYAHLLRQQQVLA